MAEKKILVVDDHFEMLEFLRSMLELSNKGVEVLAVPSAEEGLLELRRTHFDLVITDVRLPGMSGFDLVRKTKAIKSDTPVIMITAYSTAEGRQEAEALDVLRYFPKPLDTDEMLTAVHEALYGKSAVISKSQALQMEAAAQIVPNRARKRLESLLTDTGAAELMLAKAAGEIIMQVGDGRLKDSAKLMGILANNLEDSYLLAQELGNREPFTLQYHAGETLELYVANVGRDYFLAMFFDMQARRGRIGTVWVFAQRAIKDLMNLLPRIDDLTAEESSTVKPMVEELISAPSLAETAVPEPSPVVAVTITEDEPEPIQAEDSDEGLDIGPEELADLLAGDEVLLNETGELNAFWDEALTDTQANEDTRGFTLDEARRQGLIPSELDFDDQPEEN
jgi:DNA-binding NarL/FixJ family response regulator